MTPTEYDRLQKAHQIQLDLSFLRDAVAVLNKKSRIHPNFAWMSDGELVRTAMERFVTDEDLIDIFLKKINSLEIKMQQL